MSQISVSRAAESESQPTSPVYEVDPWWPKALPNDWIFGQIPGVAVDEFDNVIVVHRQDLTSEDLETGTSPPVVVIFNAEGEVIDAWGDNDTLPRVVERVTVDHERNVWICGHDAIVQKYDWSGKLLMQIGQKGLYDSTDGTRTGEPLNAAKDRLFEPASVAVDRSNGDVYVADGYKNHRIAVFDRSGRFLRQWGRLGTKEEVSEGVGGVFMRIVHDVVLSNDGLVYACDRQGDRIQAFDKAGNFKRNIMLRIGTKDLPNPRGTAWIMALSRDPGQQYLFVTDGWNEKVHVIDRVHGNIVSSFGRSGHQLGAFTHGHGIAIDSHNRIYVSETNWGRRVQRFNLRGGV